MTPPSTSIMHPLVYWAQRTDLVYLSITIEDCEDLDLDIQPTKLHFKGKTGSKHEPYECDIEFYGEIDSENVKKLLTGRKLELALQKKDTTKPYWPRLMKPSGKVAWVKIDFEKWKDEDETDEENDMKLDDMMRNMGGMGDMTAPDFGGMGGMGGMGGDEGDSDDEDMPDLEDDIAAQNGAGEGAVEDADDAEDVAQTKDHKVASSTTKATEPPSAVPLDT